MSLSIKLFGPIQVLVGDRPIQPPRSRKVLWLLALLTLRVRNPVERDWLASMLWPDSDRTRALANLRTTLSELRAALGPEGERLLGPSRHTVQLRLDGAVVDVLDFDRCMASGRRSDLEQAVTLYNGPFLEGSNEEWAAQERGSREQDCLRALQTLGETSLAGGDTEAAINWFQRAIKLDPWSDAPQRGLMEAHAKAGNINEALATYRAFEDRLRSESASRPDERTSTLYAELRAKARGIKEVKEPVVQPSAVGYLPEPITETVGREDERSEVLVQIRRSRLVTLTGLGGIGKTRLALAVASAVADEFGDGRWFVSLSGISNQDMVARKICSVLSVAERAGRNWLELAVDHLRTKRALLILDNCEHLLRSCSAIVRALLQDCAALRILTTSREPLGILGEAVWIVPPLPVPDPSHLPQLQSTLRRVITGYDGVQLFVERARAADRNFGLNSSNTLAIAEICFGLEGIPLAIELAAARVKSLGVSEIRAGIAHPLSLLTLSSHAEAPGNLALRSTLDWSYGLLDVAERRLFRRLSVFVGGCTLHAAKRVCGEDGADNLATLLSALVDKSLLALIADQDGHADRYRMLETVRHYASELLLESGESDEIERRHRAWALEISDQTNAAIHSKEQLAWLKLLTLEHANLLKAMVGFEESPGEGQEGLRMVSGLMRFWLIRGPLQEGRERVSIALEHEGAQGDSIYRARALNAVGAFAYHQGDSVSAQAYFEASLGTAQRIGDEFEQVSPTTNLGNVFNIAGDLDGAIRCYERSIELARETDQRIPYALAIQNLAVLLLSHKDEARRARELFEEALNIYNEMEIPHAIAQATEGVGTAALAMADYEGARLCQERVRAIREEIGDLRSPYTDYYLGTVAYSRGDFATAAELFGACLAGSRRVQDSTGVASSTRLLADMEVVSGDLDAAELHYEEARKLSVERMDRRDLVYVLVGLGDIAVERGNLEAAREQLSEVLKLCIGIAFTKGTTNCMNSIACLLMAEGESNLAVRLWACTQTAKDKAGSRLAYPFQARIDRFKARALADLGQAAYDVAWEQGKGLSFDEASPLALNALGKSRPHLA